MLLVYVGSNKIKMTSERKYAFNHINCIENTTGNIFFLDTAMDNENTFIINLLLE